MTINLCVGQKMTKLYFHVFFSYVGLRLAKCCEIYQRQTVMGMDDLNLSEKTDNG